MIKKARRIFRKLSPLAFLLITMATTHLSVTKQAILRTID